MIQKIGRSGLKKKAQRESLGRRHSALEEARPLTCMSWLRRGATMLTTSLLLRAPPRRNGARARRVVADARLSADACVDWSIAPGHRRHRRVLRCARRIRGPAPRMGAPTRDDAVPHDDGRGDEAGRRQGEGRGRRQGQGQGPRAQAHAPGAEGCRTAREARIEEQTQGPGAEGGDDGDPTRLGRRRRRRRR